MEIEREVLEGLLTGEVKLEDFKYRKFTISASRYYGGEEHIYAEDMEEAEKIMNSYIRFDKCNKRDTGGFGHISEDYDYLGTEKSRIYESQEEFDRCYSNGIYYEG